jgi:hypothetical protein
VIEVRPPTRAEVLDQLWRWLPGVYRARDTEGRLRAFLGVFADELWRLRGMVEQQYADHFIDSAQDWVIPYIADLVGTQVLFTGEAAKLREIAARNRADVKKTLHWRRRKGTLAGLEGVARDLSGLGVHAAEMFERTAWMVPLTHIKPNAHSALDLRQGEAIAMLRTPFSSARALIDIRQADMRVGWHRPSIVALFSWPIESFPLQAVTPFEVDTGLFRFDPLGADVALHAGGATEALRQRVVARAGAPGADITHANSDDLPIRTRDLREHPSAYVDSPLGFAIRETGIALIGEAPDGPPSVQPALDFTELATDDGLIAPDLTVYPAAVEFELRAVRLGAVIVMVDADTDPMTPDVPVPVTHSPGVAWAAQWQLRNPQGRLTLDTVAPDFAYVAGVAPFEPDQGEFHHPVLLLEVAQMGAAASAWPQSEVIVRNGRGLALQVTLPAVPALAPGDSIFFYVAADGSTYFARGDHGPGDPDRNPDTGLFGAYSALHLARASEGQRRIRPGHPAGDARWRRVVARDLCCWDRPLVPALLPGQVAVDPERGRIAFPAGEAPAGRLSVDFRFGRTGAMGAGPFARTGLPTALITVARDRNADFSSLQAAIAAAPQGLRQTVVIEVLDSAVYHEVLSISNLDFPGGLVIQAATLQTPFIVKPSAAAPALDVVNSTLGSLRLDGLVFSGGLLRVNGGVPVIELVHCTLQPATASLQVSAAVACSLTLQSCISGPVTLAATAGSAVRAEDSVLQHPGATVEATAGVPALRVNVGSATLTRCTVFGDVQADNASISNSLCAGGLILADAADNCLRFSRLPTDVGFAAFRCTSATPIFVSTRLEDAGYMHLHPNTAAALRRGAEEGGEIGAFYSAGVPWRLQNAGVRWQESIPAGLAPVQVPALPRLRFRGIRR